MEVLAIRLLIIAVTFGLAAGNVSSQRKMLDEMLSDYDVNEWPDFDYEKPTTVQVQMFINSFGSLNAASMDYSVDIFLRQHWHDPRLELQADKKSITIRDPVMQGRIWKPDTYFHNVKEASIHSVTLPNIQFRVNKTGHVLYSMRATLKLSCNMAFEHFPFDSQDCGIDISGYANTDDIVVYRWIDDNPIDLPEDLEIAQFDLLNFHTKEKNHTFSTGSFSGLLVMFHLRRQNGFHVLQTYIPTILIVTISWVSFWLDPNAVPGRVTLGVTTLLTLTTLASGIRQQLPPVSYIKAIDVWIGMCMIMVFGALLEFTLANWLANKKVIRRKESTGDPLSPLATKGEDTKNVPPKTYISEARMLDRVSRAVFPCVFLIFNFIYWPAYLIHS